MVEPNVKPVNMVCLLFFVGQLELTNVGTIP
jgi:hypothetical protein